MGRHHHHHHEHGARSTIMNMGKGTTMSTERRGTITGMGRSTVHSHAMDEPSRTGASTTIIPTSTATMPISAPSSTVWTPMTA